MLSDITSKVFALNVLAGFVATALWATALYVLGRGLIFWFLNRRGELAGWWWQITFTPFEDEPVTTPALEKAIEQESLSPTGSDHLLAGGSTRTLGGGHSNLSEDSLWTISNKRRLWSVELLRMRHRSRGFFVRRSRFKGKSWRIYHMDWHHRKQNFRRVWASAGEVMSDNVINGTFSRKAGDASHGVFQLIPGKEDWRRIGLFVDAEKSEKDKGTTQTQRTASVAWIRVGSTDEKTALQYVNEPDLLATASQYWPWIIRVRIRYTINSAPREKPMSSFFSGFAYARAAMGELSAALALGKARGRFNDDGGQSQDLGRKA